MTRDNLRRDPGRSFKEMASQTVLRPPPLGKSRTWMAAGRVRAASRPPPPGKSRTQTADWEKLVIGGMNKTYLC